MRNLLNPKKFNSLKHGVSSRHGLLPREKAEDYAALEAQWCRELRPHGTILEDRFTSIVRNGWQLERSSQAPAIFASCHPFGRAVAEAIGEGDWDETARKLLSDLNAQLKKLEQVAESLRKQAATTENAADRKRLIKAAEKWADAAQRIADRHDMAMEFFLGLGDEIRKQADRDAELDGKFNKLLTSYFQHEQMLATRDKQLPQKSRQSSADAHDDFIDELPEKPAPKDVRPVPEMKALAEPAIDIFDDDDWGSTPSKH
jgi:predicted ribosome quality control (RQC) complex YloA/Tae2 family protein